MARRAPRSELAVPGRLAAPVEMGHLVEKAAIVNQDHLMDTPSAN